MDDIGLQYPYDSNGNIDNVTEYGLAGTTSGTPISTIYYGYNGLEDDERWDDVLTWYDDTEITYDSFHNPKNWRDGMNLSWQNGSQLYIVSQSSGNSSYYYDASGARYQKLVSGVTTTYHLVDGVAYSEKRSNGIELQYLYDENGSVYGIRKNGILYYFLFNGQGDVIGIYDEYKTLQARYEYDAWGKLLSVTNASGTTITSSTHIGNVNPFRYRGYYYDVETGFYYLNSRYYDPEVKRFLTMDDTDVITATTDGTTDKNLFAYCDNNPINRVDETGFFWKSVGSLFAKVAVAAVVVVAVAAITVGTGGAGAAVVGGAVAASKATAVAVTVGTAAAKVGASAAIGWGMAEVGNYYYSKGNRSSGHKDGTPKNNQAQNKQVDDVVKKLKLNKTQRRYLHDEISGKNYNYQDILQIAKDMFGK